MRLWLFVFQPERQVSLIQEEFAMSTVKIAAVILVVAGLLGLVYGGFNYTKNTQTIKLGSVELSVKESQAVTIPVWAGVAAVGLGVGLLVIEGRKGLSR
jgi:hypothetical protein